MEFFKFLSAGSLENRSIFPISPNPVRLMPGGLSSIVPEGLYLLGPGKSTKYEVAEGKDWMRPISGEKLVYLTCARRRLEVLSFLFFEDLGF